MSQAVTHASPTASGSASERNKGFFAIFKQAASDWSEDKAMKLSASLAFYTMLAIAPLIIICIKIVGKIFQGGQAQQTISNYVNQFAGPEAAKVLIPIFEKAAQPGSGVMATLVSSVILLVSASGVFGELQDSMNTIWEVKPRPNRGIWATIKQRFFSMTLVLGTAFLLMVSLIASTVLSAVADKLFPNTDLFWKVVSFLVTFAVLTGLFTLLFKYLPDVKIEWKPALIGAVVTALLFSVGKFLLAWYLGRGTTTSVYGTFGSLVALLLWVYYSAAILFFGAEFTQAYARATGSPIVPDADAVPLSQETRPPRFEHSPAAGNRFNQPAPEFDPAYPAVPVNRSLAMPAGAAAPAAASSAAAKVMPMLIGLAVGKLLFGKKKPPQPSVILGPGAKVPTRTVRHFSALRLIEPGVVTRRREMDREKELLHLQGEVAKLDARKTTDGEYIVHYRPPKFLSKAAELARAGVQKTRAGFQAAKSRVSEYIND